MQLRAPTRLGPLSVALQLFPRGEQERAWVRTPEERVTVVVDVNIYWMVIALVGGDGGLTLEQVPDRPHDGYRRHLKAEVAELLIC